MRLALAAMTSGKGDLERNLDRHIEVLRGAAADRCDVGVFPEFSLTGSVDPAHAPQHLVTITDDRVERLVAATKSTGVAAVFGIGERAPDGPYITQVVARDGELVGVQRKRHLGEGEESYAVGAADASFTVGSTRFAIAICAESGIDRPWDAAAAADARLVLMCSAPGLHGRRTTEPEWHKGLAWWESCGLADARRHAARLHLWVAMATQAGSTHDEDFPGLAALIDPNGEVVARTADWHPGTLLFDVPPG